MRGGLAPTKLQRVLEKLESNLDVPWSLATMANEAGTSVYRIARAFTATTGWLPYRFVLRRRIQRAIEMFGDDKLSVGDVAERVGFAHHSHLRLSYNSQCVGNLVWLIFAAGVTLSHCVPTVPRMMLRCARAKETTLDKKWLRAHFE